MSTRVGLWIDHRKAVVVKMAGGGEVATLVIMSKIEGPSGRLDGERSDAGHQARQARPDDRRQRRLTGQLDIYYDAVIACMRRADRILIFGPGEAKAEFRKRIVKARIRGRIEQVETTDKLTDRQVAAKVREHFLATA